MYTRLFNTVKKLDLKQPVRSIAWSTTSAFSIRPYNPSSPLVKPEDFITTGIIHFNRREYAKASKSLDAGLALLELKKDQSTDEKILAARALACKLKIFRLPPPIIAKADDEIKKTLDEAVPKLRL